MRPRMDAEITNHRGNSTVPCFQHYLTFFAKAIWLGLRKVNMSPHYVQSANPTVVYARFLITIHDQRTKVISKFSGRLRKVGHKDMKPSSSQNCLGVGDVKGKDGLISSLGFPSCLTPGST